MAEVTVQIIRSFRYDSYDVAVAFQKVAERIFGPDQFVGIRMKWWWPRSPVASKSVTIGLDKKMKVFTGFAQIPGIGEFSIDGNIIQVVVKKSKTKIIEDFLDEVKNVLETDSIYKGKAVTSAREFMDLSHVDSGKLVYNSQIFRELNEHLWVLIEKTNDCRSDGLQIQRKVMFEGRYGTGKTMALLVTMRKAIDNGFTVFYLDPTNLSVSESLNDMIKLARKYRPALIAIEDFDREQRMGGNYAIEMLMIAIDGALSKDDEMLIVLTTNFKNKVAGGFQRPGRIDKTISFNIFTASDAEQLLKTVIPERLLSPNINWSKVGDAASRMTPAFVKGIGDTAILAARSRANSGETPMITEEIMLSAIEGLREQQKACEAAEQSVGFTPNR